MLNLHKNHLQLSDTDCDTIIVCLLSKQLFIGFFFSPNVSIFDMFSYMSLCNNAIFKSVAEISQVLMHLCNDVGARVLFTQNNSQLIVRECARSSCKCIFIVISLHKYIHYMYDNRDKSTRDFKMPQWDTHWGMLPEYANI